MKQVNTALAELFASGIFCSGQDVFDEGDIYALPDVFDAEVQRVPIFVPFDLYTFTTPQGLRLTYTTAGFPITAPDASVFDAPSVFGPGNLWAPGLTWQPFPIDVRESRATAHWKVGLDADTWSVTVVPRRAALDAEGIPAGDDMADLYGESNVFALPDVFTLADTALGPDLIGSEPWLAAVAAGALDQADVVVARAYFATMPTWPMPAAGAVPVGTIILFRGTVGEIDITGTGAILSLDDYRRVFTQSMPRNVYMASCRHRFGDARCGVDLAAYSATAAAATGTTRGTVQANAPVAAPGGSATYTLGVLTMTAGRNAGFARLIAQWDGATRFDLLNPFPYAVAPSDTFRVSAGCDKRMATCTTFANLPNFGGEPFIPVPETSLA